MRWARRKGWVRDWQTDAAAYTSLASRPLGTRAVPVERIVGSVGRAHELASNFQSMYRGDKEGRYHRVRQIMRAGEDTLPPVDLYLLEGAYYVVDGHHRVAAARSIGQAYVDAVITEFRPAPNGMRAA
jgi:hypothetical protein